MQLQSESQSAYIPKSNIAEDDVCIGHVASINIKNAAPLKLQLAPIVLDRQQQPHPATTKDQNWRTIHDLAISRSCFSSMDWQRCTFEELVRGGRGKESREREKHSTAHNKARGSERKPREFTSTSGACTARKRSATMQNSN